MNKHTCKALLMAMTLACGNALADDTDIYIENSPPPGSEPLVMFSLDYRANLTSTYGGCSKIGTPGSLCAPAQFFYDAGLNTDILALDKNGPLTFFDALRLTLKIVLSQVNNVKIGLMINHTNENNCAGNKSRTPSTSNKCSNGGTMLMGFQSLVAGDANGTRALFNSKLAAMKALKPLSSSPDHVYQGKELFFEFFRYLTGQGVYNGFNGWTDFEQGNSVDKATNMRCGNADPLLAKACFDTGILNSTSLTSTGVGYVSPLTGINACTKIYTINFLFQVSQSESDSDAAILGTAASGGMAGINLSGNSNSFDTVLEYLNDRDLSGTVDGIQNVTSYFIVDSTKINQTTKGYAKAGGTGLPLPMSEDPEELVAALTNVFNQILSVSTTFVAASVPVNVFNRANVVDNVYIALFQADKDAKPTWNGNLKKLKLNLDTLELYDATNSGAVATDGRIQFDALTFWTNGAALTDSDPANQISAGRDGRHVDRGGAGQKIPGFLTSTPTLANSSAGARQLFYSDGSTTLRDLNADATTATALRSSFGVATDADSLALLKYVRGFDVDDVDADGSVVDTRPWIMGDPLHSRPLPINYGTLGGHTLDNPAIYIAVGSNDGYMRLFRNTGPGVVGTEIGQEVWAFMPKEVMGIQSSLRSNVPLATAPKHPYGVDGTPAVLQDEVTGKAYLYFGLRRGGKSFYGLDVSNPTARPGLLWQIKKGDTGFEEMGMAYATPQIGYVLDASNTKVPAVFLSGGYDMDKDYLLPNAPDNEGRAIYVVNALTGALIWRAETGGSTGRQSGSLYTHTALKDSIASDLTIADTDGNGLIDRVLAGDTGGNIWRADISPTIGSSKLSLLASLGYHDASGRANDRRFFHAIDIVQSRDSIGPFDGVLVGSGDRENPLDKASRSSASASGGSADDYFFLIKDRNVLPGTGADLNRSFSELTDISTNTCLIRNSPVACDVNVDLGWKLKLQLGTGEKVLATATTFGNTVFFTSYLPPKSSAAATCGPGEGSGALYAVSLDDGAAAFDFNKSDNVPGDTTGDSNSLADRIDALASGGIPAQVVFIPAGSTGLSYIRPDLNIDTPPVSNRYRTFWQRLEQ